MKLMMLLSIVLLNNELLFAKSESIMTEDSKYYYYTGFSDGKKSLNKAMDEAYLEAIKELIRHSFGFNQSYIENYLSTTEKAEIYGQMNLSTEDIHLQGISPVKEDIKKNEDDTYHIVRIIKYSKKERLKEIKRQKTLNKKDLAVQKIKSGKGPLGNIFIKTKPTNAQITLTKDDNKFQVTGSSNAEFTIPLGRYKVNIHKENFIPFDQEIIVGPGNSPLEFSLIRGTSLLNISTTPSNAKVYINGLPIKDNRLPLPVGEKYEIRVEHPDYYTESKIFDIWFNEDKDLNMRLSPKKGRLSLNCQPKDCDIYIDQRKIAKDKLISYYLPAGKHNLSIKKMGFEDHEREIVIRPNKDHSPLNIILDKKDEISFHESNNDSFSLELPRMRFLYMPYGNDGNGSFFYKIPIAVDFNITNSFSLGYEYKLYEETEENIHELEYKSIRAKYQFFQFKKLSVSATVSHNTKTEIITSQGSKTMHEQAIFGAGFSLNYSLTENTDINKGLGLVLEYRKIEMNRDKESLNIGLSYGF